MDKWKPGDTICLVGAEVYIDAEHDPTPMTGLFTIEEWIPCDPSAYQWEAGYSIVPDSETSHPAGADMFFISMDEFIKQTNPKGYGQMIELEREMEYH